MIATETFHNEYRIFSERMNIPPVVEDIMEYVRYKTIVSGCSCLFDIKVVLSELISNAVIHGNGEDAGKPVDIVVDLGMERIEFKITDRGPAFEPSGDYGSLLCENGRGISICSILCKKLEYSYDKKIGNSVKAVFYIKNPEGGE
ncbi:MAG: ATP-binding protein [Clostridia bacterium]|nr:ATP-binding protein [Clostridia bacterium]